MNKYIQNKYFRPALYIVGGLFLGWIFFHSPNKKEETHQTTALNENKKTIWTCAMHPQIRMDKPGKCPICGMDLIPLNSNSSPVDATAITLTKEAAQLANVATSIVTHQKAVKDVRLFGQVVADERLLQSQVSHIPGRIDRLLVNFTGETVSKGQVLAEIYSPELVTAQQELLETAKTKQAQPEIYEAAKERLRQWKLTDNQISGIEISGKVQTDFDINSNTSGVITERLVNTGDHVSLGTVLYNVADLSHIWVVFDAYESDLPFIKKGDKLTFTLQAIPGTNFSGNITFIDPVLDPVTRVAKVRVEINNQSGKLKPQMFATGIVDASLSQFQNKLVIPRSAVLWTGKRSIVYVKQPGTEEPVFKMREIELGPMLGSSYVVLDGLKEGEEIVTNGTFSVDAAAQLEGKPSMMNPEGGSINTMPGMDMSGGDQVKSTSLDEKKSISNPVKSQANMDFVMQLNGIFDQYIVLKNAFVQGDPKKNQEAAKNLEKYLVKISMQSLSGDARDQWKKILNNLKIQINKINTSEDIELQRLTFSEISNQFYQAVKTFGLMGKTVYYQFCPMAFNKKGAYWMSEFKDIRNPYFGQAMLTCGETMEVMKF